MARAKRSGEILALRRGIADRLSAVQDAIYGTQSCPQMARSLGISYRTWAAYMAQRRPPDGATILLVIITHGVAWEYLLHGTGPMFEAAVPTARLRVAQPGPVSLDRFRRSG